METKNISCETKSAHCEGHTVLAITTDGQCVLTGGCDGEVRSWSLLPEKQDDDPEYFDVGDPVFALVTLDDQFFVGSDSIDAKTYQVCDGSYIGRLARFTSSIYCFDISPDRKSIAVGSGDFLIKLVDLESKSFEEMSGHEAPLLSLAFDPKQKFLASVGCDGLLLIWDLSSKSIVHKQSGVCEKCNDFCNSKTLCCLSWHSNGSLLAVPQENRICLYARGTWKLEREINCSSYLKSDSLINVCRFDPFNRFFAAGTSDGHLLVWSQPDYDTPSAVYVDDKRSAITCLQFDQHRERQLLATSKNGSLLTLRVTDNLLVNLIQEKKQVEQSEQLMLDNINFDDDLNEDMMEDVTNCAKAQEKADHDALLDENFGQSECMQNDQEDEILKAIHQDSEDEATNPSKTATTEQANNFNVNNYDDDEDDDLIDIGAIKSKYESKIFQMEEEARDSTSDKRDDATSDLPARETPVEDTKKAASISIQVRPIMQTPFQPGSTPNDYNSRFMVWNTVGLVQCSAAGEADTDYAESTIEVEFHNSTSYRAFRMPNVQNYTMADLSSEALLLAAPESASIENPEDFNPSLLFCMHFASWDSNKEWRIDMPNHESIEAITLASHYALAATDRRNIRLFTLSGIQLHVFPLSGPIVCLAAQDNLLMTIFHHGSGLPGEQSLGMYLSSLSEHSLMPITQQQLNSVPVALSAKSIVSWAGFTDEGSPCIVDSQGIVRLYSTVSNFWTPIIDLRARYRSDTYFVISVSEVQEQIRAISCKGARYPQTFPKPSIQHLPFELPLCESSSTKVKLEEQLMRVNMKQTLLEQLSRKEFDVQFLIDENDKKLVELLIKLFAVAINADLNTFALEVAHMMPSTVALEGAIRYASQKRKQVIVARLNQLLQERLGDENSESGENSMDEPLERRPPLVNRDAAKRKAATSLAPDEDNDDDDAEQLRPKQIRLQSSHNPFRA